MTKKTVVTLVLANLATSVLFALLTLLLHDQILAYQRLHHPGADPAGLARTLWSRPATVLCVALLYLRIVRRLRTGDPRALRRIRTVSALGVPVIGWLLVTAEYPAWLLAVQAVQLVTLIALAVTVNSRTVRSAFDAPVPVDTRPRHRGAAWTLVLLAPLIAELSLGTVPLRQAWVVLIFLPIYGGGALLIREVTRRIGGGFPSLLLFGAAYGVIEEGLVLQGLTSPHLYGAADWAPRLFGLNTAYAELNLAYHPVFSITVPIVLTELIFAGHGRRPYLRRGGLIITGVVTALGALLLRLAIPPVEDPNYTLPPLAAVFFLTAASLLTTAAYFVRPEPTRPAPPTPAHPAPGGSRTAPAPALPRSPGRRGAAGHQQHKPAAGPQRCLKAPETPPTASQHEPAGPQRCLKAPETPPTASRPPSPAVVAGWSGGAAFAFLALIFPFAGAEQPSFTHGAWALLPMAAAALVATGIGHALRRWTATPTWTPAHLLGAALGAVVGHTLFGLLANASTLPDRLFLAALALTTTALAPRAIKRH
ncbi:hypothetical protein [Actinoplanes palleronii]|uniref:Uncharacterized protein n=1 Tax=Actinoplanes palleronii TaxID=113570 RepID=A0ABQ4BGJ7_9ACTN|nr:hypothetical protein [Actinoplanes palleronii]GIE69798.1 hypothetical protein Apa02nite_059060 [Actinoplanes palleronii]